MGSFGRQGPAMAGKVVTRRGARNIGFALRQPAAFGRARGGRYLKGDVVSRADGRCLGEGIDWFVGNSSRRLCCGNAQGEGSG